MAEPKFRALPDPQSIKDPAMRAAYEAIKENLDVVLGLSGNGLLKYVTADYVQRQIDDIPTDGGTDSGSGYPPILPIPMITAEDITALGTYESIILSWDVAYDYWLAYYEIMRASTNSVGDAVVIGSTISKVYADQVGPGMTFYYWVRIIQKTEAGGNVGVLPAEGKQGSTFDDPSHLLDLLIGSITESQLYQDLADRIDLIDGTGDGSVDARIVAASAAEAAARAQAILEEALARQASDNAIIQSVQAVDAENDAFAGQISILDSEVTALQGAVSSHSTAISALQATVNDPDDGVAANALALDALDVRVTESEGDIEANASQISYLAALVDDLTGGGEFGAEAFMELEARVTAAEGDIDALGSQITSLSADLDTAEGAIASNANAISSLGARVTSAEGTITSHSSSITTLQSDIDDLEDNVSAWGSAIGLLDTRVTATETTLSSQSTAITNLQSAVGTAEDDIDTLQGESAAHSSAISVLQTTVSQQGSDITAVSEQTTQLSTTVGGHTTTIEQHALSIDGIEGEYTIKIDANGKVAGVGLINGPTGSEFAIRADRFYIVYPEGDGSVSIIPFIVGMVGGTSTVGINGALIVDGTILARMIAAGAITADKISVTNLAAISANLGAITAGSIDIGNGAFQVFSSGQIYIGNGDLQSANYQAGVSGWRLTRTGLLYLTSIVCVNEANLADAAVTANKIGSLAVTNAKIASAAVTTAKIGDAQVSTLKIAGSAVTVPTSAYYATRTISRNSWTSLLADITFNPSGCTFVVEEISLYLTFAAGTVNGYNLRYQYRVTDGTYTRNSPLFSLGDLAANSSIVRDISFSWPIDETAPSRTYTIWVWWNTDNNSGLTVTASEVLHTILGTKR